MLIIFTSLVLDVQYSILFKELFAYKLKLCHNRNDSVNFIILVDLHVFKQSIFLIANF